MYSVLHTKCRLLQNVSGLVEAKRELAQHLDLVFGIDPTIVQPRSSELQCIHVELAGFKNTNHSSFLHAIIMGHALINCVHEGLALINCVLEGACRT